MSQLISISSRDRSNGTVSRYDIKFTNPICNIGLIKSMQVSIPYTWYTVMSGINDKIYITVAGPTTYTATITEGSYTITSLIAEVETVINAAYTPDNSFSVSVSSLTNKITISHTGTSFILSFGTNTTASARILLGWNAADTASATSQVAPNIYSLIHNNNLLVKSSRLSQYQGRTGNKVGTTILVVPVTGTFGSYFNFKSNGDDYDLLFSSKDGASFSDLDFGLYFEDGTTQVPLNGLDWRITFLGVVRPGL